MAHTPASSHGGFTGGTVPSPVTLAGGTAADAALIVTTTAPAVNHGTVVEVDTVGGVPVFTVSSGGDVVVTTAQPDSAFAVGQGVAATDCFVAFYDALSARIAGITLAGGLMTACHAAPANAELRNGECVLWFDQTNGVGATKLMVKGKSADGTVKTATVATLA